MPRPPRLGALRRSVPKKFTLEAAQRKRILDTIVTDCSERLFEEVEEIISIHAWRVYRDKETPGSVAATLNAELIQVRRRGCAPERIRKLDPMLRMELELADDQLTDAAAVERALVKAIARHESRIKSNAPTDGARRATFECLATLFDQLSKTDVPVRRLNPLRREFVFAVCECAGIKCPDPTVGQKNFDCLLPPLRID